MDEYSCKSTTKSRKHNKMDVDGDGDDGVAAVDDEDDAQASNDPSSSEDRRPSASSPSRSLPKVRFLRVSVSTNVGSQIRLHRVKLFDEAKAVPPGTGGQYGWAPVVSMHVNTLEHLILIVFSGFSSKCINNCLEGFNGLQLAYLCPKVIAPIDLSINSFNSRILVKQT